MSAKNPDGLTIIEQIYAMMLADLSDDDVFDEGTIKKINQLIERDRITNRTAVLKAIKVQPGEDS